MASEAVNAWERKIEVSIMDGYIVVTCKSDDREVQIPMTQEEARYLAQGLTNLSYELESRG